MAVWLSLFLLFAMINHSSGAYCVCKDGVSEQILQKAIDYACGAGADCTQIQQGGQCYQPNTVKGHCDIAVNSYYQKKAGSGATCDFSGAATLSSSPPSGGGSCLGSSSSSSGTPSTTTPSTGTPSTGTPSSGTPSMGTPSNGTPSTVTGTPTMGTPTSTTGTPSSSSVFPGTSLGPTGSGLGEGSAGVKLSARIAAAVFLVTALLQI